MGLKKMNELDPCVFSFRGRNDLQQAYYTLIAVSTKIIPSQVSVLCATLSNEDLYFDLENRME